MPQDFHPDIRREVEMLKARENKVMMWAWIICGVLLVTTGVVYGIVHSKKIAIQEAIDKRNKVVDDCYTKMKSFDYGTEAGANEAIKFAEANKRDWDEEKYAGEISSLLGKSKSFLDAAAERREMQSRIEAIESGAKDASSKTPDELAKLRRSLEALENRGDALGTELQARVGTARNSIDRAFAARLHEDAKAQATSGAANARAALTAYTRAEDELLKLFEGAARRHAPDEVQKYYQLHFEQIIQESDALATSLFTPDVIDKTPWTDLLAPDKLKDWQNDGLKGFRIDSGTLHAVGPEPGTKIGTMDVPAAGGYRDFQLEMEFTLVQGKFDMYFRLGRRFDNSVPNYNMVTSRDSGFKAGRTFTATATFIGSHLKLVFSGDIQEWEYDSSWTKSRKGAFGVAVFENSEVKFTKLRIRELR